MTPAELKSREQFLISTLRAATPLLLEGFTLTPGSDAKRNQAIGTSEKSSFKDLVTVYDQRVEHFLVERLQKAFAGETIIGEEASSQNKLQKDDYAKHDLFWILDPIDGTTNYVRAYPFFSSTIALMKKVNGQALPQPVVAATWNPVSGEMFHATKNGGAWLNEQRLQVSKVKNPQQSLVTTGFASARSQSSERPFELFTKITKSTLGVRRDGSAALDLAYVACGRIDAYWEWGLSPWDTAAGALLVEEAGGRLSSHSGSPWDSLSGEILATNGSIHDWMLEQIAE